MEESSKNADENRPESSLFAAALKGRILKSKFKNLKTMRNKENKLKTETSAEMSVSKLNPLQESNACSMMATPLSL